MADFKVFINFGFDLSQSRGLVRSGQSHIYNCLVRTGQSTGLDIALVKDYYLHITPSLPPSLPQS